MRAFFAFAALILLATAETAFDQWSSKFHKLYSSPAERAKREAIFNNNVKLAEHLNIKLGDEIYGMNEFADLTQEEFSARYLMPSVSAEDVRAAAVADPAFVPAKVSKVGELPEEFNWADNGAVTPVKNQGSCGSCWAFSATGNMEGQWKLHGPTKQLLSFSEQHLVDCDHECSVYMNETSCDEGCNGGLMINAFEYAIKNGIELETDYPYEGRDKTCRYEPGKRAANFTNYAMADQDEEKIREYLYTQGPLAIGVDATWWQLYFGSHVYQGLCSSTKMDHGVLLTGWGIYNGKTPFWWIKNSWGSGWGDKGYIKLLRGKNKCGVANYAVTALV